MNIAANTMTAAEYARPFTQAEDIHSAVSLCSWYLARAINGAQAVKTGADDLAKAQEHLAAARRHYIDAKEKGASAQALAVLAADGHKVAAAVEAAVQRVATAKAAREARAAANAAAKAAREAKAAAKAAAKVERDMVRLRMQRDYILRGTTGQAARHVANDLAGRGLFVDPPTALAALVAEVVKTVAREAATPEHILQAWIELDPLTR